MSKYLETEKENKYQNFGFLSILYNCFEAYSRQGSNAHLRQPSNEITLIWEHFSFC